MASTTLTTLMKDVSAALEFDRRERTEVLYFAFYSRLNFFDPVSLVIGGQFN